MTGTAQRPPAVTTPRPPPPAAPATGRRLAWLGAAAAVLTAVCLLSLWQGARDVDLATAAGALVGQADTPEAQFVWDYRVPRTLLGLLVGVALGLAGVLMQALTRNPLADPGLLGVTMGGSAAVVTAIAFLGVTTLPGYVWFALGGAGVAAAGVYLLGAGGRGLASPDRMVLAGAAVSAVLVAYTSSVLLRRIDAFDSFRYWDVGSLAGRAMPVVAQVAPFIGAGALLALALARPLNALALGDDVGRALGAPVTATRAWGAVAVTLLCGAATAAAGPIGFLGLVIAHLARLLVGPDLRWLLPFAGLLSPVLLVGGDVLGRVVIAPDELAVGLVTALIGAPVFVAVCRRRRLVSR